MRVNVCTVRQDKPKWSLKRVIGGSTVFTSFVKEFNSWLSRNKSSERSERDSSVMTTRVTNEEEVYFLRTK